MYIRVSEFTFRHYCHASNYAQSRIEEKGCSRCHHFLSMYKLPVVGFYSSICMHVGVIIRQIAARESKANKSPQLPPVQAICLDGVSCPI